MKLTKCIINEQWDALFDELDVDKSGHLDYSEFWAKMAIKNSPSLSEALNQFDKADRDNDRKVSRAEFIRHMKKETAKRNK